MSLTLIEKICTVRAERETESISGSRKEDEVKVKVTEHVWFPQRQPTAAGILRNRSNRRKEVYIDEKLLDSGLVLLAVRTCNLEKIL